MLNHETPSHLVVKFRHLGALLGAGLLSLPIACGEAATDESLTHEGQLGADVSDGEDVASSVSRTEPGASVDKAQFSSTATFNGFPVACNGTRQTTIRSAQSRATTILNRAITGTDAAWNELLFKAPPYSTRTQTFRNIFNANSSDPYYFVITAANMEDKLRNVLSVMDGTFHTCHDDNESVRLVNGAYQTCAQSMASAVTSFTGDNIVRWCDAGLEQSADEIAITLIHEISHQDRTADNTGKRVLDNNNNGVAYNAHNISRWMREFR